MENTIFSHKLIVDGNNILYLWTNNPIMKKTLHISTRIFSDKTLFKSLFMVLLVLGTTMLNAQTDNEEPVRSDEYNPFENIGLEEEKKPEKPKTQTQTRVYTQKKSKNRTQGTQKRGGFFSKFSNFGKKKNQNYNSNYNKNYERDRYADDADDEVEEIEGWDDDQNNRDNRDSRDNSYERGNDRNNNRGNTDKVYTERKPKKQNRPKSKPDYPDYDNAYPSYGTKMYLYLPPLFNSTFQVGGELVRFKRSGQRHGILASGGIILENQRRSNLQGFLGEFQYRIYFDNSFRNIDFFGAPYAQYDQLLLTDFRTDGDLIRSFAGGIIGGAQYYFFGQGVIELQLGAGFRNSFVPEENLEFYKGKSPWEHGYTGVSPRVNLLIGFAF